MDVRSNRCLLEDTSNKISEASTSHCTHVHGINKELHYISGPTASI